MKGPISEMVGNKVYNVFFISHQSDSDAFMKHYGWRTQARLDQRLTILNGFLNVKNITS